MNIQQTLPTRFTWTPEKANKLTNGKMDIDDVYGTQVDNITIGGKFPGPYDFFITAGRLVSDDGTYDSLWYADTQADTSSVGMGLHTFGSMLHSYASKAGIDIISRGLAIHLRNGTVLRTAEPSREASVLHIPLVRTIMVAAEYGYSRPAGYNPIDLYPISL